MCPSSQESTATTVAQAQTEAEAVAPQGTVDLCHRQLEALDQDLLSGIPSTLSALLLRRNKLTSIPAGLVKYFPVLEHLELYDNGILGMENCEGLPNSLGILDMSFNRINRVPDGCLGHLVQLGQLHLAANRIKEFPVGLPPSLQMLEVGRNEISKVPFEEVARLGNLTELYLSANHLPSLPNVKSLQNLRILALQANQLSVLDNALVTENLPDSLEELYLSDNEIKGALDLKRLPSRLKLLDLSGNHIASLSVEEPAANLKDLWVQSNDMNQIPLIEAPNLNTIYLDGSLMAVAGGTAGLEQVLHQKFPRLQTIEN